MNPDRLTLTVPEAAARLGISVRTVYEWAAAGRLPSVHVGHRVLVPVAALETWVADHTRGGEAPAEPSGARMAAFLTSSSQVPGRRPHRKRKILSLEGF